MTSNFNINSEGMFLTPEQLIKNCPVAFLSHKTNPDLSEKYTQVNTETIIEDLSKLGWYPVEASMRKRRNQETIFSKHMITFQNPDLVIKGDNGDDVYPRILLTNSHDGYNSFRFNAGLFRLVCSNGLVVYTKKFADFKIRHIGYTFEELQTLISSAVENIPQQVQMINQMQEVILPEEKQQELAVNALRIRAGVKPEEEYDVDDQTIQDMLIPLREADKGEDLWRIFNILQEKVIRGGFQAAINGKKVRTLKPIKGFESDLRINKQLFELASSLIPA